MILESKQKFQALKVRLSCGGKSRYAFLTRGEESCGNSDWSDDCTHWWEKSSDQSGSDFICKRQLLCSRLLRSLSQYVYNNKECSRLERINAMFFSPCHLTAGCPITSKTSIINQTKLLKWCNRLERANILTFTFVFYSPVNYAYQTMTIYRNTAAFGKELNTVMRSK